MIFLEYPQPDFQIREQEGKPFIFDGIRKMWLQLTEEEWVRQNLVRYLTLVLRYPASLIALEKEIKVNGLKKRFDLLVYDGNHQPWLLVECKAPDVALDDAVLQQILRYHLSVPVPYLAITNGAATYAWQKTEGRLESLQALPSWR